MTSRRNLTAYGGLLPVAAMLEDLGFRPGGTCLLTLTLFFAFTLGMRQFNGSYRMRDALAFGYIFCCSRTTNPGVH
jgi:hypothetical protein